MKIVYSQLKKFLPGLKKPARQVADDLTLIGHFTGGFEEKENEQIIDLEVRQNRGDCLGYYGIAKDLAVFYQISLSIPKIELPKTKNLPSCSIIVAAKKEVKRLMALKITGLKNSTSPFWLKKFLRLHEINSVNMIVDLTNYIMLLYGIPCHAFDSDKTNGQLTWEINHGKYAKITTLNNTQVSLEKDTFLISSRTKVASLPVIGGKDSEIQLKTKNIIVEMATYDRVKVRRDSRKLKILTEASIRLEKDLDSELIPQAFFHLVALILENCRGKIDSNLFDYYPQKERQPKIKFSLNKPSEFAGIPINPSFSLSVLKRLGCQIRKGKKKGEIVVFPPSLRKDLNLEEDLIEEVIRFYGYDKIPLNQAIVDKKFFDITPKILYFIDAISCLLVEMGYDEIRSWPLISKTALKKITLPPKTKPISTQNNINADFPILRPSIIPSLLLQKKQYNNYKVPWFQFFEIGKVFYQQKNQYQEHYSLGIFHQSKKQLQKDLRLLFKKLKIKETPPFVLSDGDGAFTEINLEKLLGKITKMPEIRSTKLTVNPQAIHELRKQIVTLDANIILPKKEDFEKLIKKYARIIGEKRLWQLVITDIYQDFPSKKFKYTFRASYFNIDNKEAKKLHRRVFGL